MIKKEKILFISASERCGGAEVALLELITAISQLNYEVALVSLSGKGELSDKYRQLVSVLTVDFRNYKSFFDNFKRIRNFINQFNPDYLHGWMYHGCLVASLLQPFSFNKYDVLWSIRHADLSFFKNSYKVLLSACILSPLSYFLPSRIIYVANRACQLHRSIGYKKSIDTVIANPVDIKKFYHNQHAHLEIRARLGIAEDLVLIGILARYHPIKGHQVFFRAASFLVERRRDLRFMLVGRGMNESHEIKELIDKYNLKDFVYLLPHQDQPEKLLSALDMFVLPSLGEAAPRSLLEALACECIAVATDVGDNRLILEGIGKVVEAGNPEMLAEAILYSIELTQEQKSDFRKAGRERVVNKYSWEVLLSEYDKIYRKRESLACAA